MGHEMLTLLNAPAMYAIVALAIGGVVAMCVFFLIKSWCAGLRIGMDKAALKRVVVEVNLDEETIVLDEEVLPEVAVWEDDESSEIRE